MEDYLGLPLIPGVQPENFLSVQSQNLIGRQKELHESRKIIENEYDSVNFIFIKGQYGSGKSRFLQKVLCEHPQIFSVLVACRQQDSNSPYKAVLTVINEYFQRYPDKVQPALHFLYDEEQQLLQPLLPFLESNASSENLPEQQRRQIIFAGIEHLLGYIFLQQKSLLLFDDFHRMDNGSLQIIRSLLHGQKYGACLVGSATFEEDSETLKQFLENIKSTTHFRLLPLPPFTPEQTTDFISAILHPRCHQSEHDQILHEVSGGNPAYLQNLIKLLWYSDSLSKNDEEHWQFAAIDRESLPQTWQESVGGLLARLPGRTGQLLCQASVIEYDFDAELLSQVSQKAPEELEELLELAKQLQILECVDENYHFASSGWQQAFYQRIEAEQLPQLHLQVGKALTQRMAEPGTLLYHFSRSDSREKAAKYRQDWEQQWQPLFNTNESKLYGKAERSLQRVAIEEFTTPIEDHRLLAELKAWLRFFLLAIKQVQMYPPGSSLTIGTMKLLQQKSAKIWQQIPGMTFRIAEGILMINTVELPEEGGGDAISELLHLLKEHYILSLTFTSEMTASELEKLVVGLANPGEKGSSDLEYWNIFLDEQKIVHLNIIQQSYAASDKQLMDQVDIPLDDKSMMLMRDVLRYLCSSIENVKLYPSQSKLIDLSVNLLVKSLQQIFTRVENFTFAEVNGIFLINGLQANPRILGQQVDILAAILKKHYVESCTFLNEITREELAPFVRELALPPGDDFAVDDYWHNFQSKYKTRHVAINNRIYREVRTRVLSKKERKEVVAETKKRKSLRDLSASDRAAFLLEMDAPKLLSREIMDDMKGLFKELILSEQCLFSDLVRKLASNLHHQTTKVRLDAVEELMGFLRKLSPFIANLFVNNLLADLQQALKQETNTEVYERLLRIVVITIKFLYKRGKYQPIQSLLLVIGGCNQEELLARLCQEFFAEIWHDEFFQKLLADVFSTDPEKQQLASTFYRIIGPTAGPQLFSELDSRTSIEECRVLAQMLVASGYDFSQQLEKSLAKGQNEQHTIKLLELLDILTPASEDFYESLLEHESKEVQRAVLQRLKKLSQEKAVPILLKILDSDVPGLRLSAINNLGTLLSHDAVEKLCQIVNQSHEAAEQEACCKALAMIGDDRALPVLIELAEKKSFFSLVKEPERLRISAIWSLGYFNNPQVVNFLVRLSADKNPTIQKTAQGALTHCQQF